MKDKQVNKLMVIVRKDIPNGLMIAQAGHSIVEFSKEFNDLYNDWHNNSNYLIVLEIDNEKELKDLYNKLKWHGAHVVAFYEPDIDNQMTSICYYGTPEMRKHTQKLDLALSEVEVATNN